MFFIQFTRDKFLHITSDANDALNRFSSDVLSGRSTLLSSSNLPVDAGMQNLIKSIVDCRYKDNLKKMYLLSKAIEFLVMQAETCNLSMAPNYKYIKTAYDKECVMYAREYIMTHMDKPPSLSQLAKIIGINEYKLKRGFKEIFNNTVFGYLSEVRLELAKNDLLETKKPLPKLLRNWVIHRCNILAMLLKRNSDCRPTNSNSEMKSGTNRHPSQSFSF
jgi:AraC-like DNA-binding protein